MVIRRKLLKKILVISLVFALGAGIGYYFGPYLGRTLVEVRPQQEKNTPKAFLSESYDKIKENYWEKITDDQLIQMFKDASSALGNPLQNGISSKEELVKKLNKEQSLKLVSHVLANLQPLGRSGIFTTREEEQLKNTVANVNPDKDLYKDLGISRGATEGAVLEAYQKLPESQKNKQEIAYAKDVLTKKETKQRYDVGGVEPTIFTKVYGNTLYLEFKKFSPTSLEEFQQAFEAQKDKKLDSLILDLRGNVGGAIDATAYFLGFFLGKNQLAFEFYKKGEYLPFRTPTDNIPTISKYKQIVVLIDNQTQSSAEMLAAAFKKYHLGLVLGSTTKGWGTVERVFPLDNQLDPNEKYSMFLVHSITLRDDNQPIEGRGVEPDISISDPTWPQQLFSYFRNRELIEAIKNVI